MCAGARVYAGVCAGAQVYAGARVYAGVQVCAGARVCAGGLDNARLPGTGAPASSRWKHVFHNARLPDNQLCWQLLCCEAV